MAATLTSSSLKPHLLLPTSTQLSLLPKNPSNLTFQFRFFHPNTTLNQLPKPLITHFHRIPRPRTNSRSRRLFVVAAEEEAAAATVAPPPPDPSSEASRRLYIGNIPRTTDNDELQKIVEEHGSVEKVEVMYDKYTARSRRFAFVTMKTVEDAEAAIEKLNGTEVGGREIKVNITEKPLTSSDKPVVQVEESQFIDSPYKVYVGNLAKTVTTETLQNLFSEKGKVLSAKVSRVPGTSKSSGYGFVSFSSEEDVEASISAFNDSLFEGQKLRVNKA